MRHILLEWKSARAKRRRDNIAFPSPRGRLYYYFAGRHKLKPLEKKARDGDVAAQAALASSLLFGVHGQHDTRASLIWTTKALAAGSSHAKFLYGYRYLIGIDAAADPDMAIQWWKEAAEEGDPQGCAHVAWACHFGFGVRANTSDAVRWASEAARRGMASAQYWLGMRYVHDDDAGRDLAKAYFWLCLAAKCECRGAKGTNGNELWHLEPNPLAPMYGNACSYARKIRSQLERDAAIAVERAVKQWRPGEGYPAALENRT